MKSPFRHPLVMSRVADRRHKYPFLLYGRTAGLPDFSWHNIPKRGKIYLITTTLPNGHKILQMAVKYPEWPWNIPAFSIIRPSKIYPNWYFWFENKPSGNPG
jgi:hypothetical protein